MPRSCCFFWTLLATSLTVSAQPTESANKTARVQPSPLVAAVENARIQAVREAMPSAVSVFVPGGAGGGSGVVIDPSGYALTNFHVSSPAGEYMRCGMSDGNIYDAVIVGIDPVGDLALIKLLGREDFPVAEIGSSLTAQPGDWCMAIGNPFLLATNLQPTVTWGILSGVGRYQYPSGTLLEYGDCLQTDASINPGNSGGPLYDAQGRLLGIIGRCSFEKRGRVNVGVGYAISIRQAQNFLGYLHSGRIVDHGVLGATASTDEEGGVVVSNILSTSDAYRRGLRFGSEILEVDGRPVVTANDLQNVLATMPAHWRIRLTFREDGQTIETLVRLGSVHQQDELMEKMAAALPPPPPRPKKQKPSSEKPKSESPERPSNPDAEESPAEEDPAGPKVEEEIPAHALALLQRRRGYANYHFNRTHRDRLFDQLLNRFSDVQEKQTVWIIQGETDEETPQTVLIRLTADKASLSVGGTELQIDNANDRFEAIEGQRVSGLLVALQSWKRLMSEGPEAFGETYYMGTMPLGGQRPLRDCLVGLRAETETRWLSHPESGQLEAIEVFSDRDSDPAELWLEGDGTNDRPKIMDLRYGLESVLRVRVLSWAVEPTS